VAAAATVTLAAAGRVRRATWAGFRGAGRTSRRSAAGSGSSALTCSEPPSSMVNRRSVLSFDPAAGGGAGLHRRAPRHRRVLRDAKISPLRCRHSRCCMDLRAVSRSLDCPAAGSHQAATISIPPYAPFPWSMRFPAPSIVSAGWATAVGARARTEGRQDACPRSGRAANAAANASPTVNATRLRWKLSPMSVVSSVRAALGQVDGARTCRPAVSRSRESPRSGDDQSPAWWQNLVCREDPHARLRRST
jgi:hypothetical protein